MQFPATLVHLAEKSPLQEARQWNLFRVDLSISCNFQQLWFSWQKPSPHLWSQTVKFFWTRCIHFMQFVPTLVQLAEKPTHSPPLPAARQWNIFRLDLSISCNLYHLWFSWEKSPLLWTDSEKILDSIYPFHAIFSNFGSPNRKMPPPLTPQWPGSENCYTISIHFMQFPATLVQLAEKPTPTPHAPHARQWKSLDWIHPFHVISSIFGSVGRKALPPAARQWNFFRLDLYISCNLYQLWFSW